MGFSRMEPFDWSALASANTGNVFWVYYNLGSGVATTLLSPSVSHLVWQVLDLATAFRRVYGCFGDEVRVSRLIWGH